MLDENGFERDAAPSRWVMVAIWALVPLAATAFGLAVVAIFGIQTAAKERDAAATGLARIRQADMAAPRAAITATEASVARMPPQIAVEEALGSLSTELARDVRNRREVEGTMEVPSEASVGARSRLPAAEAGPPQLLASHSPAVEPSPTSSNRLPPSVPLPEVLEPQVLPEAYPLAVPASAVASGQAAPDTPLPQLLGPQALADHPPATAASPMAASHSASEAPLPQAVEPSVPQRSVAAETLAALPVLPVEPVETQPRAAPAGPVVPSSNPLPPAELVRGLAPRATDPALNRLEAVPRVVVVAPALTPPRVFIHRPADVGGGAAETVARRLGRQGVAVAAIRPVRATPSASEIRYFHEADRAAAVGLAQQMPGPAWRVRDFASYAKPPPPGTLEVWLPKGFAVGGN